MNRQKEERYLTNPERWSQVAKKINLREGDFLIFSIGQSFLPQRRYQIYVMMLANERERRFYCGMLTIEVFSCTNQEDFTVVLTTQGKVGYVIQVEDMDIGPDLLEQNVATKTLPVEKQEISIESDDFIIFAGEWLRKGDLCLSLVPSQKKKITGKVYELLSKRPPKRIRFELKSKGINGGGVFPVKGFRIEKVVTHAGVQHITTTDGRSGYNIIRKDDKCLL